MIKFEVGKVYRRLDCGQNTAELVASRSDALIRTIVLYGYTDFETKHRNVWHISVIDDIEKITAGDITILSADMPFCSETEEDEIKANIEEVKEEDKKEEKEELQKDSDDWIIEDEYEAICLETKQRFKVKLIDIDRDTNYALEFASNIPSLVLSDWFEDYKDVAIANACGIKCDKTVVIFKHGVEPILSYEEIKEKRKPVCFEVGKEYKEVNGEIWKCKAIFDTNKDKVIVFYSKDKDLLIDQIIKTLNSVEYSSFRSSPRILEFIADEQYRDEIKALL